MSERYYRIGPRIWADSASWSEDARTLAFYILTCPHRRTEGLYRLPKGYVEGDLKWSPERLAEPFEELITDGFISYDEQAQVVFICKALRWQAPANPNSVKAAIKAIEELPETALLSDFYEAAKRYCEPFKKAKGEGLAEQLAERFNERLGDPQALTQAQAPAPTHTPAGAPDGASADRLCVDGKSVTDHEKELGRQIVAIFNEVFGTSATFEANYERIVQCIRRKPDLSGSDHRRVIEAVWNGEHWWSGAAGLAVIYGKEQFEKAIDTATGRPSALSGSSVNYDESTEVHHA